MLLLLLGTLLLLLYSRGATVSVARQLLTDDAISMMTLSVTAISLQITMYVVFYCTVTS